MRARALAVGMWADGAEDRKLAVPAGHDCVSCGHRHRWPQETSYHWWCGPGGVTRLGRCDPPGPRRQAPLWTAAPAMAALPVPARTWMRLARTSGALGTRIRRTPSWAVASIASAITWLGRVIDRRNAP